MAEAWRAIKKSSTRNVKPRLLPRGLRPTYSFHHLVTKLQTSRSSLLAAFCPGPFSFSVRAIGSNQPHTPTSALSTPYTRTASSGPLASLAAPQRHTSNRAIDKASRSTTSGTYGQPSCIQAFRLSAYTRLLAGRSTIVHFKRFLAVSGVFRLYSDLHFALTSRHSLRGLDSNDSKAYWPRWLWWPCLTDHSPSSSGSPASLPDTRRFSYRSLRVEALLRCPNYQPSTASRVRTDMLSRLARQFAFGFRHSHSSFIVLHWIPPSHRNIRYSLFAFPIHEQ